MQEALKYILCNDTLLEKVKGKILTWIYKSHVPVKFVGTACKFLSVIFENEILMEGKGNQKDGGLGRGDGGRTVNIQLTFEQCRS